MPMTLQQLQYIVAVDKFRSFAKAADSCGITQPTLSKMVANLEEELDVRIFERNSRNVSPTAIGGRIVAQAVRTLMEAERIREIVAETRDSLSGEFKLSVGPSIAPYILPEFIRHYGEDWPGVSMSIEERRPENMLDALLAGTIDAAISSGGRGRDGIFEIPLYEEPFWVYLSEQCRQGEPSFTPEMLSHENMWVMREAQCLRESAFSFCKARDVGRRVYEAGNLETLIRVVDTNGGFTIIPEMHLPLLSERQRMNVRPLTGQYRSMRRVSLYIRHDYVREKMLNSVVSALLKVIPRHLADSYILNNPIRL